MIVVYTKHWACNQLNNMQTAACFFWKVSPFSIYIMLTWKKHTRLSPLPYCKGWKAGWGLGVRLCSHPFNHNCPTPKLVSALCAGGNDSTLLGIRSAKCNSTNTSWYFVIQAMQWIHYRLITLSILHTHIKASLVPRSRPGFRCSKYGKQEKNFSPFLSIFCLHGENLRMRLY